MVNAYEIMLIISPNASALDEDAIMTRVKKSLSNGQTVNVSRLGMKTLSYPIHKNTQGKYILCSFAGNGSDIMTIKNNLKHQQQILRYLIVKLAQKE